MQLIEIQWHIDSKLDLMAIPPFREGLPSSRCSRALQELLWFAQPPAAQLTFLDAVCITTSLMKLRRAINAFHPQGHSISSNASGNSRKGPVCEWELAPSGKQETLRDLQGGAAFLNMKVIQEVSFPRTSWWKVQSTPFTGALHN